MCCPWFLARSTLFYIWSNTPREIVSKNVLLQAVWPVTVVEENNLSQSIAAIRRTLGERPDEHKYIVTVPGRGFKFVAPVAEAADAPPIVHSAPARTRWRRWAMLAGAGAALIVAAIIFVGTRRQGGPSAYARDPSIQAGVARG